MLKSQTLKIALPSNSDESKQEQNQNQAAESQAFTIILDGKEEEKDGNYMSVQSNSKFYYYEGKLDPAQAATQLIEAKGIGIKGTKDTNFLTAILQKKNEKALKKIGEYKKKWENHGYSNDDAQNDAAYQADATKVLAELNAAHETPIVMIKPTSRASYADVIGLLDQMQINSIGTFQIETLSKDDSTALQAKGVQLPPVPSAKK
ncbi:MAG: hypothetical protein MJZ63_01010 [Muribaculaceae bacterium]|nr:hypothetical protein [Muribaculaceae bacterium]